MIIALALVPEAALPAFMVLHVGISLVAIAAGFVVAFGMMGNRASPWWTRLFLATTALTSLTGFGFPIHGMTPGVAFGLITLSVLPVAVYALYGRALVGAWRWVYIAGAMFTFYLNFVVLIVQSFQKLGLLHALASTQSEPPFLVVQVAALVGFVAMGVLSFRRFGVVGVR